MARSYAACLGAIALFICLLRGAVNLQSPLEALPPAIGLCLFFALIGWGIGAVADYLIRQSLETKFRQTVQQYQERQKQPAHEATKG